MNTEPTEQSGADAAGVRRPASSFVELSQDECRTFLSHGSVGRVAWTSPTGVFILPVSYLLREDTLAFRTSPYGVLAQLVTPTPVAFQVDELDHSHRLGATVLVQGTSKGAQASTWEHGWRMEDVTPWAGGTRNVFIEIRVDTISGRAFRPRS